MPHKASLNFDKAMYVHLKDRLLNVAGVASVGFICLLLACNHERLDQDHLRSARYASPAEKSKNSGENPVTEEDAEKRSPELERAIVTINHFQGLSVVDDEGRITELDLRFSDIGDDDLVELNALKHLRELKLGGTKVTDAGLRHLTGMSSLEYLQFYDISDSGLVHLSTIQSLEWLTLGGPGITDRGIAELAKLPKLNCLLVVRASITDACVENLQRIKTLKQFEAIDSKMTLEGQTALQQALPECKVEVWRHDDNEGPQVELRSD